MTTTEAAAIAGRTATTIRNWIAKGRLQAGTVPMSGPPWVAWDITPEALDAAIADQRKPGRPYKHPQAPGSRQAMNIVQIRKDWNYHLNVGQIQARHPQVTREQLHAILFHSDGLTVRQIKERISRLTDGMKSAEIEAVMRTP